MTKYQILEKHGIKARKKMTDYDYDVTCELLVKDVEKLLMNKKEEIIGRVLRRLVKNFAVFAISDKSDYQVK